MMAAVDEVEATPLIGGEGPEDKVRGKRAGVEALTAFLDLGIHGFELRPHERGEFVTGHGGQVGVAGADELGSGYAAGESTKANDQKLQEAVLEMDTTPGGEIPFEVAIEESAGVAVGEHQVLDNLLGTPACIFTIVGLGRMKLAEGAVPACETLPVEVVEIFENAVHDYPSKLRAGAQEEVCPDEKRRRHHYSAAV